MITSRDIEVFILAGGKSRRMEEDKGLALLNGLPMISHIINTICAVPLNVSLISGNPDYGQFDLPLYEDSIKDKGPMGGLMTALENSSVPYVLLMGCDMPFINREVIYHLIDSGKKGKITVSETNGYTNPLFAIYPKSILAELKMHVEKNHLKLQDFISSQNHYIVKMDYFERLEPNALTNINSREELKYWNMK